LYTGVLDFDGAFERSAEVMAILDRFRMDGQVAIITGAGRGILREVALQLARAGASIVVADTGGVRVWSSQLATSSLRYLRMLARLQIAHNGTPA